MSADPQIAWTDAAWDPIRGCTRKSVACLHCYAETITAEASQAGMWGHGFAEMSPGGASWTGKVEPREDRLTLPLGWSEPRRILVNSISDLFHESLATDAIDRVFAVMALSPQHTFQVLTKRPKTMQPYVSDPATPSRIERLMGEISGAGAGKIEQWPLPNVWLGVTAENQKEADRRIPLLLDTPAAVRWIAAEPLLEPLDLKIGTWLKAQDAPGTSPSLDWVVAGGETSAEARPCKPEWARSLRDQCSRSGTAFFWNQWGRHLPGGESAQRLLDGVPHEAYPSASPSA